jgi:hypothetical protein
MGEINDTTSKEPTTAPQRNNKAKADEKTEFKAAVGLTRKWDAREAGREVARDTLEKLGKDPHFVILFATIHYEKFGGFKEFLAGVWDVLPEGTPLIGGTVAGFINPQGCYTRGATALAVNYPKMDIATGIGKNTKRNPQKAAKECAQQIKQALKNTKYNHKFIFEVVSGGKVPNFPTLGRRKVVRSEAISALASYLANLSLVTIQYGLGREEEVLDGLVAELPDFTLLGMSSIDDNKMIENYQFFNKLVLTNVVLCLSIASECKLNLNTTYGLDLTSTKLSVIRSADKRTIKKINGKPAIQGFLEAIRWPDDFINERLYRRTFFTPWGYTKDGILFPNVLGLCLGKDIVVGYKVENSELNLLHASGRSLIKAVEDNLSQFKNNPSVALIVSCSARLEALGSKIAQEGIKTSQHFPEVPFIIVFAGGEDTYSYQNGKRHVNESFNIATIG